MLKNIVLVLVVVAVALGGLALFGAFGGDAEAKATNAAVSANQAVMEGTKDLPQVNLFNIWDATSNAFWGFTNWTIDQMENVSH